ncbi:MAG TPA: hypothetical protein VFX70_21845 [Mycobacteriales bacterium]|nr:hypothetical protein [Mycobacteriales bacterium]
MPIAPFGIFGSVFQTSVGMVAPWLAIGIVLVAGLTLTGHRPALAGMTDTEAGCTGGAVAHRTGAGPEPHLSPLPSHRRVRP